MGTVNQKKIFSLNLSLNFNSSIRSISSICTLFDDVSFASLFQSFRHCHCCLHLCAWPLISLQSNAVPESFLLAAVTARPISILSQFSLFCLAIWFWLFIYVVVIWFILDLLVVILKQLKHLCIRRIWIISASGVFFLHKITMRHIKSLLDWFI